MPPEDSSKDVLALLKWRGQVYRYTFIKGAEGVPVWATRAWRQSGAVAKIDIGNMEKHEGNGNVIGWLFHNGDLAKHHDYMVFSNPLPAKDA